MSLALEGIRILDFSQIAVGPACTQLLADLGAEVIKVERIGVGDLGRRSRAFGILKGESYTFLSLNRNKKGISLDLAQPEGREIVYKLVEKADVVVQNFRPGVMEKMGLGYATLQKFNPRLIFASASGYGLTGPYAHKPGQDLAAQSMGGLMTITGEPDGPPTPCGASVADYIGSLLLAQGITTALLVRERTGIGQAIDISLLDTQLTLQYGSITAYATAGKLPRRGGRPLYRPYKTKDGYITLVGAFKPNPLALVCSALGLADLSKDPRFDTRDKIDNVNGRELEAILAQAIAEKTTAECLGALEERDIVCAPVNSYREVVNDPQVLHNNMIVEMEHPVVGKVRAVGNPIRLSATPGTVRMPPPLLGQHNEQVLASLGYTEEEIAHLREQKVIG